PMFSLLTSYHLTPVLFSFHHPAPTEIYTLSLHDALPISLPGRNPSRMKKARSGAKLPSALRPALRASCAGNMSDNSDMLSRLTEDRKSTRLNSSHLVISYAVFCLKKKKKKKTKKR